jgi:AmmeMemoRadiSam system protein A
LKTKSILQSIAYEYKLEDKTKMRYTHNMSFMINQTEQTYLLKNAREAILSKLENRNPKYPKIILNEDSPLTLSCGAFVTIHKGKTLRGCIGRMSSDETLLQTIRMMAMEAAFSDPRFSPISKEEWEQCRLEISVLSPMELCQNPKTVLVGVHGLYLVNHGRAGVLLPQVPVEQGWGQEEYLDYICQKAGLPPKSYDEPSARLYTFTAVVFGEE